jgi:hypothetical protein
MANGIKLFQTKWGQKLKLNPGKIGHNGCMFSLILMILGNHWPVMPTIIYFAM